jgi:hypothetical protein
VEGLRGAIQRRHAGRRQGVRGRVEHLNSGRRARFASPKDLIAALERLLRRPGGGAKVKITASRTCSAAWIRTAIAVAALTIASAGSPRRRPKPNIL